MQTVLVSSFYTFSSVADFLLCSFRQATAQGSGTFYDNFLIFFDYAVHINLFSFWLFWVFEMLPGLRHQEISFCRGLSKTTAINFRGLHHWFVGENLYKSLTLNALAFFHLALRWFSMIFYPWLHGKVSARVLQKWCSWTRTGMDRYALAALVSWTS